MAFTPPPAVPQRGDRTTFSDRVDAFLTWMANLIGQLNQFLADLTGIAIGGAYSPMYLLDTGSIADGDPGSGKFRFNNAGQSAATVLFVDAANTGGQDVTALIASWSLATGSFKGALKLVKQGDPSKWIVYRVLSVTTNTGYLSLGVVLVQASATTPFANGDGVILQFTPSGDTGVGAVPTFRVQHQGPIGTSGGTAAVGANTRTLNTTVRNTLAGAALNSNQVTLPAGVYKVTGSAPALAVGNHQVYLYSITAGAILLSGTVETANNSSTVETRSFLAGEVTLSAATVIEMRHSTAIASGTGSLGQAYTTSTGGGALFAEVLFEKIG